MTRVTELTPLLKRLQLGPMAATCPSASPWPVGSSWTTHHSWRSSSATRSIAAPTGALNCGCRAPASRRPAARLEDFDWSAANTLDRRLLDAVFSLEFLAKHEHVLLVGPAGVGKSFLAQALGYAAVRSGHTVRFIHADNFFWAMAQAKVVDVKQASTNSATKRAGRFNGNRSSRVGGKSHICARPGKPGYLPA